MIAWATYVIQVMTSMTTRAIYVHVSIAFTTSKDIYGLLTMTTMITKGTSVLVAVTFTTVKDVFVVVSCH